VRNSHPVAIRHPSRSLSLATALPVPETNLKLHAFVSPSFAASPVPSPYHTLFRYLLQPFPFPKSPRIPLHMSSPTMLTVSEDRTQAIRPVP
jgi:hypothetical protein